MRHSIIPQGQRRVRHTPMNAARSGKTRRTLLSGALFFLGLLSLAAVGQRVCAEAIYIVPPVPESGAVLKYKSVHCSGTVLQKPSCDPGMTAKIFVTPVRILGGTSTTIVPIAGVSTFATDNGNGTWTVRGQVKTSDNGYTEYSGAITLIVEIYCCVNELCD